MIQMVFRVYLSIILSNFLSKHIFWCLTLCIRGYHKTGTSANSEDPDEMQHNAAFHLGLHCL